MEEGRILSAVEHRYRADRFRELIIGFFVKERCMDADVLAMLSSALAMTVATSHMDEEDIRSFLTLLNASILKTREILECDKEEEDEDAAADRL